MQECCLALQDIDQILVTLSGRPLSSLECCTVSTIVASDPDLKVVTHCQVTIQKAYRAIIKDETSKNCPFIAVATTHSSLHRNLGCVRYVGFLAALREDKTLKLVEEARC